MINRIAKTAVRLVLAAGWLTLAGCQQPRARPPGDQIIVDIADEFALDAPSEAWSFRTPSRWRILTEGGRRMLYVSDPPEPATRPEDTAVSLEYAVHGNYEFRNFSFSCWLRLDSTSPGTGRDAFIIFGRRDDARFYCLRLMKQAKEATAAVLQVNDGRIVPLASTPLTGQEAIADQSWHQIGILRNTDTGTIEIYLDRANPPLIRITNKAHTWGSIGLGSVNGGAGFGRVLISGEARPPR